MMKRQDTFDRKSRKFFTSALNELKNHPFHILEIFSDSMTPTLLITPMKTKKSEVIKIFNESNPDCVKKFQQESQFTNFSHPNVITYLDTVQNFEYQDDVLGTITMSYLLMEAAFLDFFKVVTQSPFSDDETLVRTYFNQLLNGVEYLHKQGVYHMDLKLENLVLTRDYNLKIIDFGAAVKDGTKKLHKLGTEGYRPPEVMKNCIEDFNRAEIYTMGVILFVMMTGTMPYSEKEAVHGYNLLGLMLTNAKKFWLAHKNIREKEFDFDDDFKDLFMSMTDVTPKKRLTISQIRKHPWMQGNVYDAEDLPTIMEKKIKHLL